MPVQLQPCRITTSSKFTENSRCFGASKSKSAAYSPNHVHDKQEDKHRQNHCLRCCRPPSFPPLFLSDTCQVMWEGRRELWVAQGVMMSFSSYEPLCHSFIIHTETVLAVPVRQVCIYIYVDKILILTHVPNLSFIKCCQLV